MDPGVVLKKNQNVAYRIYDGQATVVIPDQAKVEVLNEIGSLVWERIDGQRTVDQVIETVMETVMRDFQVVPEQARRDILEFIETLRESGMVS